MDLEKQLIEIMVGDNCTLSDALSSAFSLYGVDTNSVYDMVDFLENRLHNLDKVQHMMLIYTGKAPDMYLTGIDNSEIEKKQSRPNKG